MIRLAKVRTFVSLLFLALVFPFACDTGGLVGGDCKPGRILCEGTCVDPGRDPNHCGSCDNVCGPGLICSSGDCTSTGGAGTGGSSNQGGSGAAAGQAGDSGDAGESSGGTRNTGGTGNNAGRGGRNQAGRGGQPTDAGAAGQGGTTCVGPFDTAQQCGDCETQCVDPNPLCAPDAGGSFECVPACPPPLIACGDQCVDTEVHPLHCGGCFNICPSGICQGGMCVGANPGHVALYCLNYAWAQQQSAHTILLGNAVFLPVRSEVRILAFTRWAPAAARATVNRVIGWSAASRGRSYVLDTISNEAMLSATLNIQNYDVFLVYEQSTAPAGQLAAVGAAWASSLVLDSYARAGGVIVVLDGAQGTGEMTQFIDSADLLRVDGHNEIPITDTTTRFFNRAPGDALGINVVSPLSPVPNSCTFDTPAVPSPETVFVITNAAAPTDGEPAVVHRILAP